MNHFYKPLATLIAIALLAAFAGNALAGVGNSGLFTALDADGDKRLVTSEIAPEHHRLFARLLRRADSNSDGQLTPEEFAAGLEPQTDEKQIEQARPTSFRGADAARLLLLKLDTDRDARLTRDEAPAPLRDDFDQLREAFDQNKDQEIDRQELSRKGPRLARMAERIVQRHDWPVDKQLAKLLKQQGADADRFERRPELVRSLSNPKRAGELFKQLDANRDGRLVVDELPPAIGERGQRLLRRADRNRDNGVSREEFLAMAERMSVLFRRQQLGQ